MIIPPDKSPNTVWHHATVTRERRARLNGHNSLVLWFTGLSGAGKSTLAHALEESLYQKGCRTFVLDGDNVRHGLCADLGFSDEDRTENIRRIGEVSNLFLQAGVIVLTAFISPFQRDRDKVRTLVGTENFVEIYCHCPLDVCEQRDTKGLYRRARRGEIKAFTGISSPYEAPENPAIAIDTANASVEECVARLERYLTERGMYQLAEQG